MLYLVIISIVFSWIYTGNASAYGVSDELYFARKLIEKDDKKQKMQVDKLAQDSEAMSERYKEEALKLKDNANKLIKKEIDTVQQSNENKNPKANLPLRVNVNQSLRKYVFLSLSMPENAFKELIKQAKEYGFIPVLRGFKNGNSKQTLEILTEILKETDYGVNIDPELFKEFAIDAVPTFVVAAPEKICPPNMSCNKAKYNKLSGNITVSYAFKKLVTEGEKL